MPDGTTAEYKYDALWRRIEKTVTTGGTTTATRYLYDGLNTLSEYDGNNALKMKYTHNRAIDDPLAMERNGQSYYYHKDALGSITAITDSQANLVQWYQYDSFGKITDRLNPAFHQPYVFTGREDDEETGLYNYRFRYYDPEIGRFISEDPIGFSGGSINLYAYVGNNPVSWVDPLGLILTNAQIANIIFNETRSFSGDSVAVARLNIAHAIINGDNALGDSRPVTAPTTATVPSTEQSTYQQIQFAVELARFQQTEGGIDPTNGAMNFNFRNNDATSPFYGLPVQTHAGPLNNSYTGGGLNSTGVWANTYGRCNNR